MTCGVPGPEYIASNKRNIQSSASQVDCPCIGVNRLTANIYKYVNICIGSGTINAKMSSQHS